MKTKTKWVEDSAITKDKINADVAGDALSGGAGSPLDVQIDDNTIGINGSNQLEVNQDTREALLAPHGFPNKTDSDISFTDGTLTFEIAPAVTSFDYFYKGVKKTKSSADSVVITDTEGLWFFYYNGDTLTASQTEWTFSEHVPISIIYWDAVNNASISFEEERHDTVMDSKTHEYLHKTVGTRFYKGLSVGDYTLVGNGSADVDAQVSIADGVIFDEDIEVNIADAVVPSNPFEQILNTIAKIPIYYRDGVSGVWRKDVATNFPLKQGTNRIQFNQLSVGVWSAIDVTVNGRYAAIWIYATNNISEPVIAVLGQREDGNLNDSKNNNLIENLSLGGLPAEEMKILHRLIFQTSTSYSNTPAARLRDVLDFRSVSNIPAGDYVPTDHSILSGLLGGEGAGEYYHLKKVDDTPPADGEILQYNASNSQWEKKSPVSGEGSTSVMDFSVLKDVTTPYLEGASSTYAKMFYLLFPGTNKVGTPISAEAIFWCKSSGKKADIRIFDSTNSLVIAELLDVTDFAEAIQDMGAVSNASSASAIWEIQIRKSLVDGDTGRLAAINLIF